MNFGVCRDEAPSRKLDVWSNSSFCAWHSEAERTETCRVCSGHWFIAGESKENRWPTFKKHQLPKGLGEEFLWVKLGGRPAAFLWLLVGGWWLQGGDSGISIINLLIIVRLGSLCSCSARSHLPPPGWGPLHPKAELRDLYQFALQIPQEELDYAIHCITVSSLLFSSFCPPTSSNQWLWICPLELWEDQGGWNLVPQNKKWGTRNSSCAWEGATGS